MTCSSINVLNERIPYNNMKINEQIIGDDDNDLLRQYFEKYDKEQAEVAESRVVGLFIVLAFLCAVLLQISV